ncbi:MAG TPA: transglycosylase SLT domain-containing protein [Acetobacteraceae bacterium]|jgi:hypothetical protein|nr:transglycosylase SLT domain-containing protein [Acetobacteraceae bacterium]
MRSLLAIVAILLTVQTASARSIQRPPAPTTPSGLCDAAITATEAKLGIPKGLLHAIGTVESGHWPWIIDVAGEDRMFQTKDEAVAATQALLAQGVKSIDVGCVQVNLMWHPNAFASLDDAFEPRNNVAYGGHFLRELYVALGSWDSAAGAYHSQTPDLAEPYRQLVMARWMGLPVPPRAPKALNTNADVYGSWPPRNAQFAAMPPSGFAFRCCSTTEKSAR